MQQLKQEKMKQFSKKNYYFLSVLAKMCGVSQEDVIKFQTAQCIPGHSYETRLYAYRLRKEI